MTETVLVELPERLLADFQAWLRRYGLQTVTSIDRVENIRARPGPRPGTASISADIAAQHLVIMPLLLSGRPRERSE